MIHGEAQDAESDLVDGRHSPPTAKNAAAIHPSLEMPSKSRLASWVSLQGDRGVQLLALGLVRLLYLGKSRMMSVQEHMLGVRKGQGLLGVLICFLPLACAWHFAETCHKSGPYSEELIMYDWTTTEGRGEWGGGKGIRERWPRSSQFQCAKGISGKSIVCLLGEVVPRSKVVVS